MQTFFEVHNLNLDIRGDLIWELGLEGEIYFGVFLFLSALMLKSYNPEKIFCLKWFLLKRKGFSFEKFYFFEEIELLA